jgi:imidazolonepropionase-like amidohydrolase
MARRSPSPVLLACLAIAGCSSSQPATVFVGGRIIDGTGGPPIDNGALLVRDGRIEAVGPAESISIPDGAERIDVSGRTIIPGLINSHGHVGGTLGLEQGHYSRENVLRQLALNARYGVTTVNSLGDDGEAGFQVRNAQSVATLDRARLHVAGTVVAGDTPEQALAVVDANGDMQVDFIKIRVDDNLGTTAKMPPAIYQAVIERAHERGLRVAAHVYYLDDAKALLRAGVDLIAHSVRDRAVDDELIGLLARNNVCYIPTLTREISTFVYEDVPSFFHDPFFLREADAAVLEQLQDPERQQRVQVDPAAQQYKRALVVAQRNLEILADAGVTIAMGTDAGPPARFQGYFEHLELSEMADAGLDPMAILVSATGDAARCLGFNDVGTLEAGKWADFVVLTRDPLADITNTRSIESVWIAGNQVPTVRGEKPDPRPPTPDPR